MVVYIYCIFVYIYILYKKEITRATRLLQVHVLPVRLHEKVSTCTLDRVTSYEIHGKKESVTFSLWKYLVLVPEG